MSKTIKTSVGWMLGILILGGLFAVATPVSAVDSCSSATLTGTFVLDTPPGYAHFKYSTDYNDIADHHETAKTQIRYFNDRGTFHLAEHVSDLLPNTTYYYELRAYYGGNKIHYLGIKSLTTPPCSEPAQDQTPTVQLTADDSNISFDDSTTIRWNSNNADSCNAVNGTNGWFGGKSLSGSFFTGNLTNTTTFSITCSNNTSSTSDSVTIFVDDNNDNGNNNDDPTVSLRADDTNIDSGDDTTIRWSSTNADSCRASGGDNDWSGSRSRSGTFNTGDLDDTTTFRITCTNENGSDDDSVTIRVGDDNNNDDEPDVTTRNATDVNTSSATLNGRVDGNGSSVRAWFEYGINTNLGNSTSRNSYSSGSTTFDRSISGLIPNATYYFRAVAENSNDTVYGSILSFNTGNGFTNFVNQPTVIISADSTNVAFNSATNIRWYTTDATSCFASGGSFGWAGAKSIGSGSFYTGSLTASRTFIISCSNSTGSSTDSVTVGVRGQVLGTTTTRPTATSLVLITSSVDRNQPIVPTLDNTKPHPGDEINYTVSYQNIGTGSITDLTLQVALPQEVNYMSSNGMNPSVFGNSVVFNLGTLKANSQGSVTVRVLVRNDVSGGTILNFPATLSYIDPSNSPQSVTANVSAQIWSEPVNTNENGSLGANAFGAGFLPTNIFEWLFLIILVLLLALIAKHFLSYRSFPFHREIVTTLDKPSGKKTTTTTIE